MDRRDLERVDGGIDRLRRRRLTSKVLVETAEIAEERVREDVFPGPRAKQERLDGPAALRARGAERCYEDEGKERRRFVHVDPAVEQELHSRAAPREHRELQESRSVRRRNQDVGGARKEAPERGRVPATREGKGFARRLVTQAHPVRSCPQRRRRLI